MKSPLLSKYCCLEKLFHLAAANSLMLSEQYAADTKVKNIVQSCSNKVKNFEY